MAHPPLMKSLHNNLNPILLGCTGLTFHKQPNIFRTHPDINVARMIFNHELSIQWKVCVPPHFDLQYTQALFYPDRQLDH